VKEIKAGILDAMEQEALELQTIFNSTINGIIIINREGIITKCNITATKLLGLEEENPIGATARVLLPEMRLDDILTKNFQQHTERVDYKKKALICNKIPVMSSKKELTGGMVIIQDAFGYQAVLEELSAAQSFSKQLDAIIEASYDGIYITDGKANTLMVNKAYEDLTGLKRADLIGHNMVELERRKIVSQSATLLVLKENKTTTIEQEFKTGKKVLVTSTPIFDDHQQVVMVVTNVRDITSLIKLQEQLEQNKELAERYFSEIEEMRLQFIGSSNMIAQDEKMLETLRMAKRVAKVDTTVLILGETGVGKEEVAKFIHKNSKRENKVFMKVNCGAIPKNLIESELFGYEKGAFTGANREGKTGLFEFSHEGTLFLDEVGELPLDMQVRLLRVLQEQEIVRIGGHKPIKVDVRILAATNRPLEDMVHEKKFREDLYYRLNVVPIRIMPLRDRRGDILPLIQHYVTEFNEKYKWQKGFSSSALKTLYYYQWPGNVRELKNLVERELLMNDVDLITDDALHKTGGFEVGANLEHSGKAKEGDEEDASELPMLKDAVEKLELHLIDRAYNRYGNVRDAAKALGIDASTLVRKRQRAVPNK